MNHSTTPSSGFTHWLATSRAASGRLLLAVGLALAAAAVWLLYKSEAWSGGPTNPVTTDIPLLYTGFFTAVCAIAFMACGGWQLSSDTAPSKHALNARLIVLILTGAVGAGLFFLGLGLLYTWGDTLTKLIRDGEREGAWRVLVGLAAALVGLMIMFGGLQSVRTEEKQIIGMRRYVYGFNAVLTGLLLLAVLVVINVLCFLKLPASIDATQSGSFTLSERSRQVLADLDEPVTVYVVMFPERSVYGDVRALLSKSQEVSSKITVETVSPRDGKSIEALAKKFPRLTEEAEGLLIVVNDDPNRSTYIPARDLVQSDFNPMGGGGDRNEKFVGESKLINEISFVRTGKQKPIVYITQGYGEPDINDQSKRGGLGILKDRLQRRNFEVKPLKLDLLSPQVPDDAGVVVVAGPKQPMPAAIADALKAFMDKGGKMIAMFDVVDVPKSENQMPVTGLEALMAFYGVDVTRDRIFSIVPAGQGGAIAATDQVVGEVDPKAANQPIVVPFKNSAFQFISCRNIRPLPESNNPGLRAQTLITTMEQIPVWTESNPHADIQQTLNLFVKDREEAKKRLTTNLPLMIAVSESPRPMPGQPPGAEKPKLVVFGDTTFVANLFAQDREAVEFDLFIGALEWLRERPANIGIEARPYQYYEMDRGVVTYRQRLIYMPLLVASVIVLGLGIGVWLARRQ
jgi:hypothetical protein